ncbi:coiled-coil domain-containing protein 172 isoform X2 [Phyllopteryx taeniolatus]|nr:coiled-coil domain-containing protein 172 isoform X2 [Phyllopteryx taeniolatus]XP_061645848.1 coiled-coil domain-containing protein 172 isoform X2 [Phyllopteryx taeniolatus]XP_061645849.1 coiled-coil domain-containing protein 172 isoform X2 [Phyllopteryx taeniolatus]
MSLDKLFHQILRAEQHFSEQTQKLKEVKAAIIRSNSQLKATTETYQKTTEELEVKDQQLSVMRLQWDLMKKCNEQISQKSEELLAENAHLQERLARMKTALKDEEREFLQEISSFNCDFSLCGSSEMSGHTLADILNLDMEVDSLYKVMEEMIQSNCHVSDLLKRKRSLQLELQALKSVHADLERQLSEAKEMTAVLRAESHAAGQKAFTDSDVVTLRKELEMHQEGDMELLLETLKMEVQHLQSIVTDKFCSSKLAVTTDQSEDSKMATSLTARTIAATL